MKRKSLIALCAALVLCSPIAAVELGMSVGRDGTTLAAVPFESQPLGVTASCGLRPGQHFVLRLMAGYGVLLNKRSIDVYGPTPYDHTGLDALRVQAAPLAEADLPMMPVYVRTGVGFGAYLDWTSTRYDGDPLIKGHTRGLDASALFGIGVRINPRLSLELSMERLLADWSFHTDVGYTDESGQGYTERYRISTTSLNWNSVIEPGYAVGLVWGFPGTR